MVKLTLPSLALAWATARIVAYKESGSPEITELSISELERFAIEQVKEIQSQQK